ncbi:hypothetical protein HV819_04000 [Anaerococcus sp. AGMB00486]|uniref:Amino acid permease n=2 Tax=Anaerococcus TaxID=165779 RepID=A0ABX2N903_9FIRM|nr:MULTISPECIES: hypothetical protein [Anaerococcus]MDY3007258.1 hypothetical protein [Anaerococcus porci]MSS77487.1 hypothetical protein [Anaerococcus porci]NVF11154.1 hypothetical protein [Anaerococcus faecalis]
MKLRRNLSKNAVVSIALMLFSAHAGGGFATGNQANTYFVGLGFWGIFSAILAMVILCGMLREAMIMKNSRNLSSYKEVFENLYHPFDKLAYAFEAFYLIMVVMVIATTISSAASALSDSFGFSYKISLVLISALILLMVMFGANLVRKFGAVMGILILVTSLSIYFYGSFSVENPLGRLTNEFSQNGFLHFPKAIENGFVYAGFQCVQIPAMIACCGVLKNKEEVTRSMNISSLINSLALALSVFMLFVWKDYFMGIENGATLPTLTVTKALEKNWISVFYLVSLILCLISSAVTITYGMVARFEENEKLKKIKNIKVRRLLLSLFIVLGSMLISSIGLTNIIKYGYGYCGYLAIFLIIIPFLTIGAYKNYKYMQKEENKVGENIQISLD